MYQGSTARRNNREQLRGARGSGQLRVSDAASSETAHKAEFGNVDYRNPIKGSF
jgi:type V secretory pathway adhesin AidA